MSVALSTILVLISVVCWVTFGVGCGAGQSTSPNSNAFQGFSGATGCQAGTVALLVADGFLGNLCGCTGVNEADGTIFQSPASLTCHVSQGANTVFFYYLGTTLRHQIVSTGSPTFVSSPISNPQEANRITVHAVSLPQTSATYHFIDIFSGLTGQIIVP